MFLLLMILGGAAAVYYMVIVSYAGVFASFSLFWLAAAIGFWLCGVLYSVRDKYAAFMKEFLFVKVFLITTIVLFFGAFLLIEGIVVSHMDDMPEEPCDVVIVLGCQVRKDHMTKSMKYRLEKTYEYATENPNSVIIVSGGMGKGEDIAEAVAMHDYLVEKGIPANRILMERYSTSTKENLKLSCSLISDIDNKKIGIVSNSFHIYRALKIADKLGIKNVSGIAADSDKLLMLNNLVREFFALVKEKLVGNI